jgi:transglutaminase/protease-like cytokinesis protein 3
MVGRRLFCVSIICFALGLRGVAQVPDYAAVDRHARDMQEPITELSRLDSMLSLVDRRYSLPEEKIRFVFTWMASNLEYDCGEDDLGPGTASTLEEVLRTHRSKCMGYSSLMNYCLRKLGFESVSIRGVAKTARKDLFWDAERFPRPNHAWNAVKVRDKWELLDPTWASGEASENCDTVIRAFAPFYFFPQPRLLALSHFPADSTWQLLEDPLSREDFISLPVFHDPFYQQDVRGFFPAQGIVRVERNGWIRFRFRSGKSLEKIAVWSDERKDIGTEFGRFSRTADSYEYAYRVRGSGDYFLNVSLDGQKTSLVYRIIAQ